MSSFKDIYFPQLSHFAHSDIFKNIEKIVEYKSTPVGVISITEIKEKDGTCSWGMYIDEKFSNLGIGILMEIHAIDRMINHHRIRKICGQALESNRILLTHKRFGFEEEGILKEHVIRNGKPEDVILIALFSYL